MSLSEGPGRLGKTAREHLHRNWRRDPDVPAAPLADRFGLSPHVAKEVIALDLDDCSWDLARIAPVVVHTPGSHVAWPVDPPPLPTAPPVVLTVSQQAELDEQRRQAARLADLQANPDPDMNDADLEHLRRAARRIATLELQADALAFYTPFGTLGSAEAKRDLLGDAPAWGIYVTSGGIEQLAKEVFSPVADHELALRCAFTFLLGHELGHAIVDGALATADNERAWEAEQTPLAWASAHEATHEASACPAEEAFCEAYALAFFRAMLSGFVDDAELRESLTAAAREHVELGLPGYADGAAITGRRELFQSLQGVLRHVGVDDAERAALLADIERLAQHSADVPVRIVMSPGSALADGQWLIGMR